MEAIKKNFDKHWIEDTQTGCWNWTGALIGKGYAQFQVRRGGENKTDKYGHRWSWRIHKGRLAEGDKVLHKCDNPRCVNPNHLFVGTTADNAQDMKEKGRHLYGERNSKVVLTETKVLKIHAMSAQGVSQATIARNFGVSQIQVSRIIRGERWGHVLEALKQARSRA